MIAQFVQPVFVHSDFPERSPLDHKPFIQIRIYMGNFLKLFHTSKSPQSVPVRYNQFRNSAPDTRYTLSSVVSASFNDTSVPSGYFSIRFISVSVC